MSQTRTVILVDDLDGSEGEGVKKRKFALDGIAYEIDLNDDNYERLCEVFAPYKDSARRVPRRRTNAGKAVRPQK